MKKIGILGGTFDPIHIVHLMIAEAAYSELSLDAVWIMPTGDSPHKNEKDLTPLSDRLTMIELAVSDNPNLLLSYFEVESGEKNYTYRTAERLSEKYPEDEFYYIFGADSLALFPTWKHPEIIARHFQLVAAERLGSSRETLQALADQVTGQFGARIHLLTIPDFAISSTLIRQRISEGKSIRYLVPENVREYISNSGLYRQ